MRVATLRLIVQAALLALLVYAGLFGMRRLMVAGVEPTLPTLSCEYGRPIAKCFVYDLEYLLSRDASRHYRGLVEPLLFFVGLGLVFGRSWCGWACPLGFVQDLATRLRERLRGPHWILSPRLRTGLLVAANVILVTFLLLALLMGWPSSRLYALRNDLFRPYCLICPSKQLSPLLTGQWGGFLHIDPYSRVTIGMSWLGIAVFLAVVALMWFVPRIWCRLCAMGLLMRHAQLNALSVLSLRKDVVRCTGCGNCSRACPVGIREVWLEREADDATRPDCVLCLRCVEACPEDDVLRAQLLQRPIFASSYRYFAGQRRRREDSASRKGD